MDKPNLQEEARMLAEYEAAAPDLVMRHIKRIPLIEYFYKLRHIPKYELACEMLCQEDLAELAAMNEAYIQQEAERLTKSIEKLQALDFDPDDPYVKRRFSELDQVYNRGFCARIPAFDRLGMIAERREDFECAALTYLEAIHWYKKWGMATEPYEKKLERVKKNARKKAQPEGE